MGNLYKIIFYYITKSIQVLFSNYYSADKKNNYKIVYYPVFKSKKDLADQVNRIRWFITNFNNASILLSLNNSIKNIDINSLKAPSYQRLPSSSASNPNFIICNDIDRHIKDADIVCVWDTNFNYNRKFMIQNIHKLRIIDPDYYLYSEAFTNGSILWYDILTKSQRKEWVNKSYSVYKKVYNDYSNCGKSYLFGTGPSIQDAYKYDFSDGVRIICNTIVKNDKLLDHIKPNIIAFADTAFHFGVSKYCETFAKDVLKVVRRFKCYIVTNQVGYALMRTHYPELLEYLIGVPAIRFGPPKIMDINNFATRAFKYTILTRIMIPLAAGLSNKIVMLGFDGREFKDNDYFWKHNHSTQYMNNMKDVSQAHKSFFDDTNYESHYLGHCKVLKRVIRDFEKKGKKFEVLGNSFVPILKNRLK